MKILNLIILLLFLSLSSFKYCIPGETVNQPEKNEEHETKETSSEHEENPEPETDDHEEIKEHDEEKSEPEKDEDESPDKEQTKKIDDEETEDKDVEPATDTKTTTSPEPIEPEVKIKREVTLTESEPEKTEDEAKETKKLFENANDYDQKAQELMSEIDKKIDEFKTQYQRLDSELDDLLNKVNFELGEMKTKTSELREEIETLTEKTQAELDLEKNSKELTDIRLEIEGLTASEKSIMSLMKIANERITEATSSAAEITKNKTTIIHESDANAQKAVDKIIELYGEIKESSEYLGRLEESFNTQIHQLEKNKSDIEKRTEELQENIKKLETEISQEKEKEEPPSSKKVKKTPEFSWYENIIIYIGNSIKWVKSFFMDVNLTTTPTKTEEFHEMPIEKPAKELLENIVTDTGALMKKGFRKVGDAANKIVEKSEELQGQKKPNATTKPEPKHELGSSL